MICQPLAKAEPRTYLSSRKAKAEPRTYLWSRQEYDQLVSIGLFDDKRVELIEGRVIEMSSMGTCGGGELLLVMPFLLVSELC